MPDQPIPLSTFRGLNLVDAVDSVGDQCIDCLNVDLDRSGTQVRSRDGYDNLTTAAFTGNVTFLWRQNSTALLASTDQTEFYSVANDGTKTSLAAEAVSNAANFGTPSSTSTYYSIGSASTTRKLVGTTVSTPTATVDGVAGLAMPKGGAMAVQESDNRLVVNPSNSTGGPNGVASSVSHIWFSEPGNAEAWSTNNYVQLTPGDGETIRSIATWRGQVFVFKDTKLFVFYGNSTDASGNPIFNYRTVTLSSRIAKSFTNPVTVGEDGVYYVANDGVYMTTGDAPAFLSGDLYPFGLNTTPATFTGGAPIWSNAYAIHFHKRRLFVSLKGGNLTMVYDIDSGNWVTWQVLALTFATWEGEESVGRLYFGGTSIKQIYRFLPGTATDDGAGITSYYRTGFYDLGDGDQKTIHNVDLWGTGTVAYSTSRDFNTTLGTARNVTLGTSPAIGYGRVQPSPDTARGNLFSHKFADSSGGAWSVQRVVQNVQAKRPPGPKGT